MLSEARTASSLDPHFWICPALRGAEESGSQRQHSCLERRLRVERWLALITERAIRRNSFTSVRELKQQIELFVQLHNADTMPFK